MLLKTKSLPSPILQIVVNKSTETPFTGEYNTLNQAGTYCCRQCGLALFRSHSKFVAACGWPSFDEEIAGAVKKQIHHNDLRTEICCARCDAHLGHVFQGERYTEKNTRHCVNSLSLDFITEPNLLDTEEALFAGGCFWGVEYYFKKLGGVVKTEVGYTGGPQEKTNYAAVCAGNTGHYEAVRVVYDPKKISYQELAQYFFEIHDPTQMDGQGLDVGEQYLSVIFYYNEEQKISAQALIRELEKRNYRITTKILPVSTFHAAEQAHQNYYGKNGQTPYCHRYTKRFA